jgi:outer membrane putative beta-barrel porin/alpha-amylase
MSRRNSSQSFCLPLLFFSILAGLLVPGARAQAPSSVQPDNLGQGTSQRQTEVNKPPDGTKASRSSGNDSPKIQDNSFLVEEAYNQEFGIVQHIQNFQRLWNSKDWIYTFTQEWPVDASPRHQLSYTLAALHSGQRPASGGGFGDVILNYRYQLWGSGESKVAFAPRLSALLPTGDSRLGRGAGGAGIQGSLPLSVVLTQKLVTHWNAGTTIIPNAKNTAGETSATFGYNFGQSFVWLARPRFNVLLETVFNRSQQVTGPKTTEWTSSLLLSPGIRWAYNFNNGLQIVPGIGVPLGVGPSTGEKGVFLYLSFEHPYRKLPEK